MQQRCLALVGRCHTSGGLVRAKSRIRRHVAQQVHASTAEDYQFRAQCHPGLEAVVAEELQNLPVPVSDVDFTVGKSAGVAFRAPSMAAAYHACIQLRAAIRVLHLLGKGAMDPGAATGWDALYRAVRSTVHWPDFVLPGMSVSVDLRMRSCERWNHSSVAEQCIWSAVCDAVQDSGQPRPPPPGPTAPRLQLFVTMWQEEVQLYRDVSGESLHRRGFRGVIHKAALNEVAAAGVLYLAGWPAVAESGGSLVDCMCGSGTLLVEAALMAHHVAPGLFRKEWAHHSWPDFDRDAWRAAVRSARGQVKREWAGVIAGNDVDEGSLVLAQQCLQAAQVQGAVRLNHGCCSDWRLPAAPDLVVTNPPWGQRLGPPGERGRRRGAAQRPSGHGGPGGDGDVAAAWHDLRAFLVGQCPDATAYVLCGSPEASRALRMRTSRKIPIQLAGIDTRLLRYHILPRKE